MKLGTSNASPKRRPLALLYLICLAMQPAPTIAATREISGDDFKAPPNENSTASTPAPRPMLSVAQKNFWMKRGFAQGQPELQQAMDNLLGRERVIKRTIRFPPVDVDGYPSLLTRKTAYLLSEAEHMLNRVKNVRERRWVETFIHRLKILSSFMEQSISVIPSVENKGRNITSRGNSLSLGRTLAPENHVSFNPTPTPVAPEISREQKTPMPAKNPVILSHRSQVLLPNPVDGQVVLQTGFVQQLRNKKLDEGDELVRELESLHKIPAVEDQPQNATPLDPSSSNSATPPPNKRMSPVTEDERVVAALQHFGITPDETRTSFRFDTNHFAGFRHPESDFNQNPNIKNEVHSFETEKNTLGNPNTKAEDLNSEDSIMTKNNMHIWRPSTLVHPASYPPNEMYMNMSFQGMNINSPPMNQQKLSNQIQNGQPNNLLHEAIHLPHYNGIKNTIQKLKGQSYEFNNHVLYDQQLPQKDQQKILAPEETKQNPFMLHNGKDNFNPYLQHNGKDNINPYMHSDGKNSFNPYLQNAGKNNLNPGLQHGGNNNLNPGLQHGGKNNLNSDLQYDGKNILNSLSQQNNKNNFNPFLQYDVKTNFNPSLGLYRPRSGYKYGYSPYPYFPNINHKNSTIYGTPIFASHSIDNNFSDEMKRQLRDGKVILLSDSVVRSNFEQTPEKDKDEAPGGNLKSEGKNETQAQN